MIGKTDCLRKIGMETILDFSNPKSKVFPKNIIERWNS